MEIRLGKKMPAATTLIVPIIVWLVLVSLSPIHAITYFVSDDAYYYLQVAKNITAGLGPTFDGLNRTNGYHPLWLVVVLPIYAFFGDTPGLALRLVIALQGVLGIVTARLVWAALASPQDLLFRPLLGVIAFLIFASPIVLLLNGLETGLVLFLTMSLIVADQKFHLLEETRPLRTKLALGLLLALLVLARLDSVFFLVALALWKILTKAPHQDILIRVTQLTHHYWPTFCVFGVLVGPYFIWNYSNFHHLMPISGTLKSSFPWMGFELNVSPQIVPFVFSFAVLSLWVIGSLILPGGMLRNYVTAVRLKERSDGILFALWLGCLMHLVWTLGFMRWGVYQWHFALYIPLLVLWTASAFAMIVEHFRPKKVMRFTASVVALLVLVAYSALVALDKGSHHKFRLQAADWAKRNTSDHAVFAIMDAGVFGYFSGRRTINLDGVINSYEYQQHIVERSLPQFFNGLGLDFVGDAFTSCRYSVREFDIISWGRGRAMPAGYRIRATPVAEAYKTEPTIYRPITLRQELCLVLWRYSEIELSVVAR